MSDIESTCLTLAPPHGTTEAIPAGHGDASDITFETLVTDNNMETDLGKALNKDEDYNEERDGRPLFYDLQISRSGADGR